LDVRAFGYNLVSTFNGCLCVFAKRLEPGFEGIAIKNWDPIALGRRRALIRKPILINMVIPIIFVCLNDIGENKCINVVVQLKLFWKFGLLFIIVIIVTIVRIGEARQFLYAGFFGSIALYSCLNSRLDTGLQNALVLGFLSLSRL
jgi:hypothetical protein